MTQSPSEEGLTAFCSACPAPEDVTAVLAESGFQLTFQMQAMISPAYSTTASLPAQFHYRDAVNTELIYLAGRDPDQEHVRLPSHASRWWLYPGRDGEVAQWVAHLLSARWSLNWQAEHVWQQAA